ncbi:hypothetical protein PSC71_11060 [Devosia sp. J2-20]|jgi:uncharacterized membrane protein|uniref:DUF1254 domain-containing protein n=1 Tax=Devosia litorisediminis TaxID=2829817 RepID=A0A942E822_9HYPH|nr:MULTISPECIES: hypothetical protein [Devosia]MBS3849137.1 hypothetical protein [Devosia litorisediminis]MCZ4344859.1 hypothetical protein [Devosia neptuniae]WDQ97794.1 hypothetical protein PSC71_11060 [Devosia sp. J2-20]|tara:strand:+ start:17106 stop:17666 length:561 start_codon:yes stop_codon:yes gene_type:complete
MMRLLLWLAGGVLLGGIIHIIVILTLPRLDEDTVWTRIAAIDAVDRVTILPQIAPGEPNPLGLDPEVIYGVCQLDLAKGPGYISGVLPEAYWSVAIYNEAGVVTYSTTNRDGIGQTLEMGIFNAAQTRLLAQQQLDVAEGLLVVESDDDNIFALVRLLPPHQAMRARFADVLAQTGCGNRADRSGS